MQHLFRGRKLAIKAALLNQTLLAGVGNIYADESLFRAGIRPRRRAGRLTRVELEKLRRALREVLRAGDPAGRIVGFRLCGCRRCAGILPTGTLRVPAHRRALPQVRKRDQAHRGGGTEHALLRALSAIARATGRIYLFFEVRQLEFYQNQNGFGRSSTSMQLLEIKQ